MTTIREALVRATYKDAFRRCRLYKDYNVAWAAPLRGMPYDGMRAAHITYIARNPVWSDHRTLAERLHDYRMEKSFDALIAQTASFLER